MGLLTPSAGQNVLDGAEVQATPAEKRACAGIARTFQNLHLFRNLSVRRNIELAEIHARDSADRDLSPDAMERFGLLPVLDEAPGSLPYGQTRRL
ncbi:hypothetical protein Q4543_23855 [Salipiger sp. 1_MG-2023]|nr:hypothetical protein [Salipiger sp. 1_MG-2023]MDO6588514.1 hypothetical protein [Salipiger sp. 1_MG-2023]